MKSSFFLGAHLRWYYLIWSNFSFSFLSLTSFAFTMISPMFLCIQSSFGPLPSEKVAEKRIHCTLLDSSLFLMSLNLESAFREEKFFSSAKKTSASSTAMHLMWERSIGLLPQVIISILVWRVTLICCGLSPRQKLASVMPVPLTIFS